MRSLILFVLLISVFCGCIHPYKTTLNEEVFYQCELCHLLTREVYQRRFKTNQNELLLCPLLRSKNICPACYRVLPHHLQEMYELRKDRRYIKNEW